MHRLPRPNKQAALFPELSGDLVAVEASLAGEPSLAASSIHGAFIATHSRFADQSRRNSKGSSKRSGSNTALTNGVDAVVDEALAGKPLVLTTASSSSANR